MNLPEILMERELVVCVGSGGVGKTTTAAAMGLWAAGRGRRVMVLTIDPARRLAQALGLRGFGNERVRVEAPGPGTLFAMMLDTRSALDDLMGRLAPNEETRDRILANGIYRQVADTFGGQEYMASEKLLDLVEEGEYELVVLDTPPVKNALDFLEAPARLSRFFDRGVLRWFLTPYEAGRLAGGIRAGTSAVVFRLLGYVFGRDFLADLSEFLLLFRDMYDGFRERYENVTALLAAPSTAFVTVCAPTAPSVEVASFFAGELLRMGLPRSGIVVNQLHRCRPAALDAERLLGDRARRLGADLPAGTPARLLARLDAAHGRLRDQVRIEAGWVERIRALDPEGFVVEVPRIEGRVHEQGALLRLAGYLCKGG